jgi:Peptidase family M28/PA domain
VYSQRLTGWTSHDKRVFPELNTKSVLPFLACFLLLICCHSAHEAPSLFPPQTLLNNIRPEGIRAHMAFLSDDLLEGRGPGTRGHMLAAKYIEAQFQEMGLTPAGERSSYLQNVRLRRIETPKGGCRLVEKRDGKARPLAFNRDFVSAGSELVAESSVEAPLVFVGYGVTAPEFHYDDYAGIDVKGKIVVFLTGAPATFPSAPRGVYSGPIIKARNAAAHGAVGLLIIWAGPLADRVPFTEFVKWFREPNMRWLNSQGVPRDSVPEIRGWAWLSDRTASEMFDHAQKTLKEALDDAAANKPQAFPLPLTVSITQHSQWQELNSPNVAAILPGADPNLKDEYVVFTAHADHLGIGDPVNGDAIYNGAIDNASGTGEMLEIAHALSSKVMLTETPFGLTSSMG